MRQELLERIRDIVPHFDILPANRMDQVLN